MMNGAWRPPNWSPSFTKSKTASAPPISASPSKNGGTYRNERGGHISHGGNELSHAPSRGAWEPLRAIDHPQHRVARHTSTVTFPSGARLRSGPRNRPAPRLRPGIRAQRQQQLPEHALGHSHDAQRLEHFGAPGYHPGREIARCIQHRDGRRSRHVCDHPVSSTGRSPEEDGRPFSHLDCQASAKLGMSCHPCAKVGRCEWALGIVYRIIV